MDEDNSVTFHSATIFIEIVEAIPLSQLHSNVASYVAKHYNRTKITKAGKLTNASGKHMFGAENKGKDLVFNEKGIFIQTD